MEFDPMEFIVLAVGGLGCYAVFVWLANGRRPPANESARRRVGLVSGALAMLLCAASCALWQTDWTIRGLILVQAALLAASGSTDIVRSHPPLSFTLAGIGVAMAALVITPAPTFLILFGLAWAILMIAIHGLASRGALSWRDHIATLWIALCSPANGIAAVATGDFANAILGRALGLRGKKMVAAGAWLICAAALAGLPPFFQWFIHQPVTVKMIVADAVKPSLACSVSLHWSTKCV